MAKPDPLTGLYGAIRALLEWLDEANVRGVIIGGAAVSIVGRPRTTNDVDAVVILDDAEITSFLTAGKVFGLEPRIADCVPFASKNRVLLLRHAPSRVNVDISLCGLAFELEMITGARRTKVRGISMPLPTPEQLIAMKILAHRARDIADIEGIIDLNPRLDRKQALQYAAGFAEALDQPELVADLKRIFGDRPKRGG